MSGRRAELEASLGAVEERIAAACVAAGRSRDDVQLIVVTKFFPASDVALLADLGVRHIGENRDQEASVKLGELDPAVREQLTCHFIGQLQSNKARHVVRYADVVQSVDRVKIAGALDRAAADAGRTIDVLMQIDLAGDDAGRGGALVDEIDSLATKIASAEALRLRGVMAVAPREADPGEAFARLATLAAQVRAIRADATWISAGMSGDLEQAVAHGATHLRVGSAILGSRPLRR